MMSPHLRSWMVSVLVAIIGTLLLATGCSDDDDSDQSAATNDVSVGICAEGTEGCEDASDEPTDDAAGSTPAPTAQPCTDPVSCQEQATNIARRDLAAQLGVDVSAITVASSEAVRWPDSCLGISREGIACAQVITPGFRLVLASGDTQYEYHTDMGTRAVLLDSETPTASP